MYFLLFYDYVEDVLERREPYRDAHLALVQAYAARGEVILGGALMNPTDGAVIVFNVDDQAEVERFVNADPYVAQGLVTAWTIREWAVVVGSA